LTFKLFCINRLLPGRRQPQTSRAARARYLAPFFLALLALSYASIAQVPQGAPKPFPYHEKLEYLVEWRLITAGIAQIEIAPQGPNWETRLKLQSAGMVSKLYLVNDNYRSLTNDQFCGINTTLEAQEGKRHRLSTINFDNAKHKLQFQERDFVKNTTTNREETIAPCTHEILGALAFLRLNRVEAGRTITLPVTDGKKTVMARIEAQAKEPVSINGKNYQTVRYEAFLFDNVLYQRKGRLWIWMTDDVSRVPVQIRVRLGFPIGTISLTLNKDEQS
jgi:hypothetical protein